jgi:hypothetical protein
VRPFQDRYARERALLQTRPSDLLVNIVTEHGLGVVPARRTHMTVLHNFLIDNYIVECYTYFAARENAPWGENLGDAQQSIM